MSIIYSIFCLVLVIILIYISVIDIKTSTIKNKYVLAVAILALMLSLYNCYSTLSIKPLLDALIGGVAGGLPLAVIIIITNGALGAGDMKLCAALGMFFGVKAIVCIMLISIILAGLVSATLLLLKLKDMKSHIVMAPFITMSSILIILFQESIYLFLYNFYRI